MNCEECKELLVGYVEGFLDESQKRTLAEHLKSCRVCQAELKEVQRLQERLVKNGETLAHRDLEDEVMNQVIRRQSVQLKKTVKENRIFELRRFLMKSPITKLAAAAAIILIAVVSLFFFGKLFAPPYAIAQTIEALENISFLHVIMHDDAEKIVDERWIEVGPDGFQQRYRQDSNLMGESVLIVDDRKTCFVYDRIKNTVVIYDPNEKQYQWISNLREFFQDMAGDSTLTIEENVDYHGQKAHRVRWLKLNQNCYIDTQTKLPMAVGPYEVYYGQPPAETFEFTIPDHVKVYDTIAGQWPESQQDKEIADQKFDEARKLLAKGEYAQAANLFESVVQLQPGLNWAWFWLGQAQYKSGQYDKAIDAFTKVIDMLASIKMVPHYCYLARGLAYRAKGMEEKAKADFAIALPIMLVSLSYIDGAMMFDYADDPLYQYLPDDQRPAREQSLARMTERLVEVTGKNFIYKPGMTPKETEQLIQEWHNWWQQNIRQYQSGLVPLASSTKEPAVKKTWAEARDEALEIISTRSEWPDSPQVVARAFWEVRSAKNYKEMEILWPGSGSWNWAEICKGDSPVKYVFAEPLKDNTKIPYASQEYFDKNGSYNLTMWLSSIETPKGRRYYIVSGN
jgi:tetratricopeptide (TPR) repeat protein